MSNQIKWIPEHGIFFPISADFKVYPSPGPGIFNLVQDPNPMSQRLGLQKVAEKFEFPFKVYDLGIDEFIEKIKKTWNSEYVISRNQNLGIIFNGIKGTGQNGRLVEKSIKSLASENGEVCDDNTVLT